LETETERLHYEFLTLKAAIEKALKKGYKSMQHPDGIPGLDFVFNKDPVIACMNARSGTVGWVDDF
jgi:hypothetical protein